MNDRRSGHDEAVAVCRRANGAVRASVKRQDTCISRCCSMHESDDDGRDSVVSGTGAGHRPLTSEISLAVYQCPNFPAGGYWLRTPKSRLKES